MIQPDIDLSKGVLRIQSPQMAESLELSLAEFPDTEINLKVCGDKGVGRVYTDTKSTNFY